MKHCKQVKFHIKCYTANRYDVKRHRHKPKHQVLFLRLGQIFPYLAQL